MKTINKRKPIMLAQIKDGEDDAPVEEAAAQVDVENTQEGPQAEVAEAPVEETQVAESEAPAAETAETPVAEGEAQPVAEGEAPAATEEAAAPTEQEQPAETPVEEEKPKPKPAAKKKIAVKKAAPIVKKAVIKKKKIPVKKVEEAPVEEAPAAVEEAPAQEAPAEEVQTEQAVEEVQEVEPAPARRGKAVVKDTADVNQAAAVAAAAAELIPEDKPWAKMSAAEKSKKKAKDAAEKQAKKEKEERENPTVDENGEHIQTVAEAKAEAKQLQEMLDAGTAAVEQKIQLENERMANEPAVPEEPVKQEEEDGHIETVEEVKARMAQLSANMEQGLAQTDNRVAKMQEESQQMPDFGALSNLHGSIANMGKNRKKKQMQDMAEKLGVELQPGDEEKGADDLTSELIERAKATGKSDDQIQTALAE